MRSWYDQAPGGISDCPNHVLVARFDEMDTRFAVLSWGRALLTNEFDVNTALTFAQQWMDQESLSERGVC